MITITKSREVSSPIESVWDMLTNSDSEQKYWPALKNIKILSRKGNTIEREATVSRGPVGNAKSLQTLVVDPKKSIALTMTKGPMLGTRKITLSPLGEGRVRIDVMWQFEVKGIPGFAQGFVEDNISEGTDRALSAIAKEAEAIRPGK